MSDLPHGRFALHYTFRPMDDLPIDVSPCGGGAKHLWGESPTPTGRNVHARGETSMGRTVRGAKRPDTGIWTPV